MGLAEEAGAVKCGGFCPLPACGERVPSELASEAGEGRLWMPLTRLLAPLEVDLSPQSEER